MKEFFAKLKRWYQRRFRGYVAPARPGGTAWQQHPAQEEYFHCKCGWPGPGVAYQFDKNDYVIRTQDHTEHCDAVASFAERRKVQPPACSCPVTDARYVKICPQCRLGHWKQAT